MDVKKIMMSKNGLATLSLAKEFIKYPIGSKIPTVSELSKDLELSRGTLQNSLKLLTDNKAIKIRSKGHMGSYLIHKNIRLLLQFADITSLLGTMPLPYSKKYEGFASGLIVAMENIYDIPTNMAYMRGAKNRISMLMTNRYDYAIVSHFAAKEYLKKYQNICIIKNFGAHSYLSEHVLIFNNYNSNEIVDGMRVGVDFDSIDHRELTEDVCQGKKVNYIPIEYSQILKSVVSGEIDAAVWNKDEIDDKTIKVNYKELKHYGGDYCEAVMVVSKERLEIAALLQEIVDVEVVLNIQRLVEQGKITPSY